MSVLLGDVCGFLNGGTPSKTVPEYFEGNVPWITGADITGPVVESARSFITEAAIRSSATNRVSAGTVLLVTRTSVGKVAIAGTELCFSQDITALTCDREQLDPGYLVHFLRTQEPHFERLARGATIKGITRDVVARLEIPLPPLPEQRRIAAILDHADALRAKRRAALAQLDTLTQSIFLEMFGDPVGCGCREKTVGEIASRIRTGPFGSQLLHSEFTESGVAVLGIDNAVQNVFAWGKPRFISERKFNQLRRYQVLPGDVLITIMATCGRCAVVPDDIPTAINTKHLCCITLDKAQCLPGYLHACFLIHPDVLRRLGVRERGAVMPGLNMQIIRELVIPLPPLDRQREFARRVAAVDELKFTQRASLAKLDELFASLQHRAFRGEL